MKHDRSRDSDTRRARDMLICGLACAAGVALFAVVARASTHASASPGALSRPHQNAALACAACHAQENAAASCTGCHESAAHTSTRPGHARMRAEGSLGCTDCHRAHGEGQTVTLESSGAFVRSGGGAEITGKLGHGAPSATVPLVPLTACARCHDLGSRTDPAARCGDPTKRADLCMDEHKRAGDTHRFAAWTAAADVARTTSWIEPKRESPSPWGFLGAGLVSASAALVIRRRKRVEKLADAPIAPPAVKRLPVIDTNTCLGCHACVDACPFDVIEVEKFVAVVARPDDCCGVVLCEQACPNGSLRVSESGEVQRMVDDHLESVDVPGLFLAGDLTGLPLIKNALRQGTAAIDRIADALPPASRARGDDLDVIVIGAGPAGLAASLRAKERGLRAVTFEQHTIAASIQAFPRHKLVYDQPLLVPCEGELWMSECTKEELIAQWSRVTRKHALAIREHHRVAGVSRDGDWFVVRAEHDGNEIIVRAARIVMAIGRRGSPRKLPIEIAPSAASKIFYHLADARSLAGDRVLVVGLGDSAMEAAIALASQPGTSVTLCHRGADFDRGRARNIAEIKALAARKKIDLRLSTEVVTIDRDVTLESNGTREKRSFDAVFVLIGGIPAWSLLESAGVQIVSADGA